MPSISSLVLMTLDTLSNARWVVGDAEEITRIGEGYGKRLVYDSRGAPLILFENEYTLRGALARASEVTFYAVAP